MSRGKLTAEWCFWIWRVGCILGMAGGCGVINICGIGVCGWSCGVLGVTSCVFCSQTNVDFLGLPTFLMGFRHLSISNFTGSWATRNCEDLVCGRIDMSTKDLWSFLTLSSSFLAWVVSLFSLTIWIRVIEYLK